MVPGLVEAALIRRSVGAPADRDHSPVKADIVSREKEMRMCGNRGFSFAALAAAVLLVLGCSSPIPNGGGSTPGGQRYIKLTISVPNTSRSITVTEYQVTGMHLEVLDPHDVSLQTIDWDASEGGSSYMIPVSESGEHTLNVTQFGDNEGEPVEVSESASFDIEAMKITVIEIVPGMIAQIVVAGEVVDPLAWLYGDWVGEEEPTPTTDVLTVNADGTYSMSANYDGSGDGFMGSGTWSYDPPYWTLHTPMGDIEAEITKISNDDFLVGVVGGDDQEMYRKGTEPGGWIFDRTPIELLLTTGDVWTEQSAEDGECLFYLFQAPAAGDYWFSWEEVYDPSDPFGDAFILVSAYHDDGATAFFGADGDDDPSPQMISLVEGENVYVLVHAYGDLTFRIHVQQ